MPDADRLEALEFKIAHLERGLQELSDVVVRQQRDLDRLQREFRQLAEQLLSPQDPTPLPEDPDQVPPHY